MKLTSEKLIVVIGRMIDALGSLVFLKLLAISITKADMGSYLLASSLLAVVLTISFSAFDQGLMRNIADYNSKHATLPRRYSAMVTAYTVLALIIGALVSLVMMMEGLGNSLHTVLIPWVFWLACDAIKNLNLTVASGLRSRTLIAIATGVDYTSRILLLSTLALHDSPTPAMIIGLLAISSLAASFTYMLGQRQLLARFSWLDIRATLHESLAFCWPMIIWGLFGWLQNMSNRWLLDYFAELSVVAEYGVLVSIASFPVTALLGVIVTYIVPILYEHENKQHGSSFDAVLKVALYCIPAFSMVMLVAGWWHKELISLLSAPEYALHSQVLPWIVASASFSAICSILTYAVYAQRRLSSLLLANTVPGIFSLAFGYAAVKEYQLDGAILTLILSHIVAGSMFIITYLRARSASSMPVAISGGVVER
ncbi:lipopolysaccharide biosynthesis protein [Oxalicibacterium faecigallinarum]|uniref:Uncharacterized protein n=1 Tax=Oxalicibacterium faecigallinarum TaxID=573741 RepID=A0A8J3AQ64_9BURK|nr:oligosaccharide flippase family protein [Oxalicibacterium faecigallinarum]GGI17920.1 hypothetical protein GCM10008066_11400 [Oxalicibacterium faecigallinarum]